MEVDEVKMDTATKHEENLVNADLINVSEGFHLRTCYKRKVKTSKLDGLLERRVKQFALEEKQRLERLKLKASASSSGCNSLNSQKNIDDLQIAKAGDGKQMDIISQNRTPISGTIKTEDSVQEHLSSSSPHITKTGESVQSLPCLNKLLEGEADLTSVQCPDTQSLVVKDTNKSGPESMDAVKIQGESKERDSNDSVMDPKPVENKETNKCVVLEGSRKCSEQTNSTGAQCENVTQPVVTESSCEGRGPPTEERNEKQDCDSLGTLEDHPEAAFLQANDIKEKSPQNNEGISEHKIALNENQTAGGVKPLQSELLSEKAFETQIPDMIGANIDEVVKSKITKTNGEKQDQEKCVPPSSINNCFDQIKSIADRNNNKNGGLDVQTEKASAFQINGKETDFRVLPKEECLQSFAQTQSNIDSKVNNISKNNPLIKPFSSNELVKPFMNGDIAMEDTNENNNLGHELCEQSSMGMDGDSGESDLPQDRVSQHIQDTERNQSSLEKSGPTDDTPMPALCSYNENNLYSEMECTEPPCVNNAALSPVISCEESSLSNDFADQNGLQTSSKVESVGGENAVKAVVTEVTTTSTISTESKTVYKVSELSSVKVDKENVVSSTENCSSSTVTTTTTTTTTVTKLSTPTTDSNADVISVKEHSKTVVTTTMTDSLTTPGGTLVTTMTVSKEYSTKDKVKLMKFSRPKKTRSGTALPSYRKFVTKSSKKSIFVLPNDDLKKLARKGGIREVPCFNYSAKPALDIWPYPSPRPTFGITWRYNVNSSLKFKFEVGGHFSMYA